MPKSSHSCQILDEKKHIWEYFAFFLSIPWEILNISLLSKRIYNLYNRKVYFSRIFFLHLCLTIMPWINGSFMFQITTSLWKYNCKVIKVYFYELITVLPFQDNQFLILEENLDFSCTYTMTKEHSWKIKVQRKMYKYWGNKMVQNVRANF